MVNIQARAENMEIKERQIPFFEKAAAITGLGVVAVAACIAQRTGMTNHLPAEHITESMAHPVFGYAGALFGIHLARRGRPIVQGLAAFASTTAANFSAELGQAMLVQIPGEGQFWETRQIPETVKDYGFALMGLGLYYLHQYRKRFL